MSKSISSFTDIKARGKLKLPSTIKKLVSLKGFLEIQVVSSKDFFHAPVV